MATLQKRNGAWRAIVRRKGFPAVTKTFDSYDEAKVWGGEQDALMKRGQFVDRAEAERTTFGEALDRYLREVTPTKKSIATETRIITRLKTHKLALRSIASIRGADMAEFRDERLKTVKPNTVRLDLALVSHLFTIAVKEWGLPLENPIRNIRMPKLPPGRDRRLVGEEEKDLLKACASSTCIWLEPAVKLAIETAMRQGEILGLRWTNIDLETAIAFLPDTKSGESRRVPLSKTAVSVFKDMPRRIDGVVFPISQSSLEHAFLNACRSVKIDGLRFHDLRHEATSRLFEKGLNPMEVAAVTGHKTLQMLKRYTHLRAEDLVARLG